VLLAARGETYGNGQGRTRDLVIGVIALIYAIWLVYAGGVEYLLTGALFYLIGSVLFVWARRERKLPIFTPVEWAIFGVVAVAGVWALISILNGNLSV